ncbi:MAG: sigma-70 family RNA polymerase sigma factor [Pseudonocardia sp.]|nr:sigma-70 family RNA polymerase sigma factor [Pseudonocardia sp.]
MPVARRRTLPVPRQESTAGTPGTADPSSAGKARPVSVAPDVAAANSRWVNALTTAGDEHDRAIRELHAFLLKIAYAEGSRKGARIQLGGPELDDIAHQAAADATMTIRRKAATFRGDCRFTTWAYRFVAYDVSSKITRHHWQRADVSIDDNDWAVWSADDGDTPDGLAEGTDLLDAVRRIIRDDLTDRQQRALEAIAFRGVSVSQVASDMESNPNAIYKTMFDARKKLRTGLVSAGYLGD